jgi:hypothetical protein
MAYEASWWHKEGGTVVCDLCFHHCSLRYGPFPAFQEHQIMKDPLYRAELQETKVPECKEHGEKVKREYPASLFQAFVSDQTCLE